VTRGLLSAKVKKYNKVSTLDKLMPSCTLVAVWWQAKQRIGQRRAQALPRFHIKLKEEELLGLVERRRTSTDRFTKDSFYVVNESNRAVLCFATVAFIDAALGFRPWRLGVAFVSGRDTGQFLPPGPPAYPVSRFSPSNLTKCTCFTSVVGCSPIPVSIPDTLSITLNLTAPGSAS
jgi:hypothetical protein